MFQNLQTDFDELFSLGQEVNGMPINEKEYNGYLFDQLTILEDLQEVAEKENAVETLKLISKKRKQVERKLYQQLPLKNDQAVKGGCQ